MRADDNLFLRLFTYRLRDGHTPKENFLTEGFAYVLSSDRRLHGPVVEKLTGGAVTGSTVDRIETQTLRTDSAFAERCIPDAVIYGSDESGAPFELWLENKWDAQFRGEQLERYLKVISGGAAQSPRTPIHLTFIAHNPRTAGRAKRVLEGRFQTRSFQATI
jgi:hypothetical protein